MAHDITLIPGDETGAEVAAAGVEPRDVQRAVVQQFAVRLRCGHAGACGCDAVAADEFEDVLEARVFAGVDDRAAVLRHRHPRARVCAAA